MTSALSPLYAAAYAALRDGNAPSDALQALGVTYVGDRPAGAALPYVLFTSDTETEDPFYSDASGRVSDATLTLTVWARDAGTALDIADSIIRTLTGTLALPAGPFGSGTVIRTALDLNNRLPAQPGEAEGRVLRFRYTASPVNA